MIAVHRLGHGSDEPIHLNSDLIVTVEGTPDTVVTLATGQKVVVAETPEEVLAAVFSWRISVAAGALQDAPPEEPLAVVASDSTVRPLHSARLKIQPNPPTTQKSS